MSDPFDDPGFSEPPSLRPATRIDRAHVRPGEESARADQSAPPPDRAAHRAAADAALEALTAHQVRLQAAQLASHLERQQASIDHREAELNARAAAVENEIRAARVWLDERHAELAAQKSELDQRERNLAARAAAPDDAARERAAELDRREAELERAAARLSERLHAAEPHGPPQHHLHQLEAYRQNLERAEALLADENAELERRQHELAAQRADFRQAMQAERRRLAEEQARAAAEHERASHDLARQTEELNARQAALARMQADVQRAQQEMLETRLATEELWTRLRGTMAPAALAQALAETRFKLAEEQKLERAELAAERAELQGLAAQLAQQHDKLVAIRAEVQTWARARHEELRNLAALLAERERQLEAQRAADERKMTEWQSERYRLEQELRRLLRQTQVTAGVAAA